MGIGIEVTAHALTFSFVGPLSNQHMMANFRKVLSRVFKPSPRPTPTQRADAEREQRVAARDSVEYSYTVFWTKTARGWDAQERLEVAQRLTALINSPDFEANPFDRVYTLDNIDGAHSGASLVALQKVLAALRDP